MSIVGLSLCASFCFQTNLQFCKFDNLQLIDDTLGCRSMEDSAPCIMISG